MNLNGTEYFYLRNAQGDIIGLIDGDGVRVVSYAYDSWGKPIVTDAEKNDANDTIKDGITGSLANTVGVKNPYRYRGYRYDTETSLYYLQSRYYNPEWGRFLNADGLIGKTGDLLGHNLFVYCKNNAINGSDPTGFMVTYADVGGTSYFVYMPSSDVSAFNDNGVVEVNSTISISNLASTSYGTTLGVLENISKKVVGYTDKSSVLHLFPKSGIPQTIRPYANVASKTAKAITVVTGAFDIAHTWDYNVKLSLKQRIGKTVLQASGIGIGIAVGIYLSGPLLASAMASGGLTAIGGIIGAGAIDFTASYLVSMSQSAIYRKKGLE